MVSSAAWQTVNGVVSDCGILTSRKEHNSVPTMLVLNDLINVTTLQLLSEPPSKLTSGEHSRLLLPLLMHIAAKVFENNYYKELFSLLFQSR